jgi:uncharacterized protein YcaQ
VLDGDRFVARIEPTFNKKNRTLTVQNWWWEPGIKPNEQMIAALIQSIVFFLKYLKAESLQIADSIRNEPAQEWLMKI